MTVITFDKPDKLLNLNDRMHWRPKAKIVAQWRLTAAWCSINLEPHGRSLVSIDLPIRTTKARRDPSNWYPTLKACIDGLVDSGVWPDDHAGYVVTEEPRFHQGDNLVTITITELTS